ncbi:MAG: type IVa pilus pseudopilin TppE [Wenzhouxiangellaceae bacterium]
MNRSNAGFTLLELIITITVIVLLVALALPNAQTMINRNRLVAKTNDIVTAINLARSEAVTRAANAGACPSADGAICSAGDWDLGWIVWVDANGDAAYTPGEEVRVSNIASSGNVNERVTVVAGGNVNNGITFTPLGMTTLAGPGIFTLTHTNAMQNRQITVSPFGQITTVCAGAACPP